MVESRNVAHKIRGRQEQIYVRSTKPPRRKTRTRRYTSDLRLYSNMEKRQRGEKNGTTTGEFEDGRPQVRQVVKVNRHVDCVDQGRVL